ncbi:MAG: class I SAM-dependent methyltransferase [Candidatus Heimdallarchaeota archaeon]
MIDYDKIALDYSKHRRNVHPEVLKGLLLTSGIGKASKVLEVGCGTANYIIALESATGCSCWGLDPSEQMLSVARQQSDKIEFMLGRAEHFDFPPNFFDLVFSVDVIHHVGGHFEYFQEAYRVLKKGGKICTTTDSEWVIRHRQPLATHFPETIEAELVRYPRIAKLRNLMNQAGFSEINDSLVEFSFPLTDIQAFRDKAFSSLHLISENAFQKGLKRLEQDLHEKGHILCISRYVLLWGTKGLETQKLSERQISYNNKLRTTPREGTMGV